MTVTTSSARHLIARFAQPATLPDAILGLLRDEVVMAGWMRASGVLSDVKVRVGASESPTSLAGPAHVVALEGSVGLAAGDVSCGMRAVLTCETESGTEIIAGEIVEASIETLEVLVTAFDDVTVTRQHDAAGAWVLDTSESPATAAAPAPSPSPAPSAPAVAPAPAPSAFSEVVREAERAAPPPPRAPAVEAPRAPAARPSPTFSPMNQAMPQRIARPVEVETEDDPVPEPGDFVEHFAFGRCEVVKTDGDRLHLRLGKDQRIKEIALEMLKVTAMPPEGDAATRTWKLARKL
jgi:predicted DNA-binding protein with PD1-like motif